MGREMGRWKVGVCLLVLSALVIGADIAVSNPEFHSSQRDAPLGPVSATRPEQTQIGANAVLRPGLRVKRENSEGRRLPRRDSTTRNHVGVQLHPTSGRGPALGSGAREHSGSTAVSKLGSVFEANSASKLSVVN